MHIRIRDWDEYFEQDRSRQWKNLKWVPIPNKQGSGYRKIMAEKNGLEIFACWIALVQVASTSKVRGDLTKYDLMDLSRLTLIESKILEISILYLSQELDWIEVTENLDSSVKILQKNVIDSAVASSVLSSSIQFNSLNEEGMQGGKPPDPEKPPEINADYRSCSELLKKRIQERRQAKIDETKLRAWDTDVRLMVVRDKRSTEQIRAIIIECHDMQPRPGSGFTWRDQILSMSTLRRQWNDGKIFIGMNKKPKEEDEDARWAFLEKTVEVKQ